MANVQHIQPVHQELEQETHMSMEEEAQPQSFNSTSPPQSDSDSSPPATPDPTSAINELQLAFPSILTATKDRNSLSPYYNRNMNDWGDPNYKYRPRGNPLPPLKPVWTGSFELLNFPRELRDRIYYFYLVRILNISYRRASERGNSFPFEQAVDPIPLYLTCKQVYAEALAVFCRYNVIEVTSRSRSALEGTLRLFPDRPARLIQQITIPYAENRWVRDHEGRYYRDSPHNTFIQILRDAYTLKSHFPLLRIFNAPWEETALGLLERENLDFHDRTEGQNVIIWKRWMRRWIVEKNIVPPSWVRLVIQCAGWRAETDVGKLEPSMNEAYTELVRELRVKMGEEKMIEESRASWLEELEQENKQRRKRRQRRQRS